jgi:hypothetical protein
MAVYSTLWFLLSVISVISAFVVVYSSLTDYLAGAADYFQPGKQSRLQTITTGLATIREIQLEIVARSNLDAFLDGCEAWVKMI